MKESDEMIIDDSEQNFYDEDDSYDEDDMETYTRREVKRKKIIRIIVLSLIGIIIAFIVGFIIFYNYGYFHKKFNVIKTTVRKDSNSVSYIPYRGELLKYSTDGMAVVAYNGENSFDVGFDMVNPKAQTEGRYVVVADIGGKLACCFDGHKTTKLINVDYNIMSACISADGYVALLLEQENSNVINIYNPFSATDIMVAQIPTNISDGYPVDVAISPDSHSVVTAYVSINNDGVNSKLSFYNFSEAGKSERNNLVGVKEYSDKLVADVEFMTSDNLVAFDDKGFTIWSDMESPKESKTIEAKQDIISVYSDSDYVGYVERISKEKNSFRARVFKKNGEQILSKKLDFAYNKVYLQDSELIFVNTDRCEIYRLNGTHKFEYITAEHIQDFLPAKGARKYYLLDDNNLKLIKLTW